MTQVQRLAHLLRTHVPGDIMVMSRGDCRPFGYHPGIVGIQPNGVLRLPHLPFVPMGAEMGKITVDVLADQGRTDVLMKIMVARRHPVKVVTEMILVRHAVVEQETPKPLVNNSRIRLIHSYA